MVIKALLWVGFVVYLVDPNDLRATKMFHFIIWFTRLRLPLHDKKLLNYGYTRLEERIYVWVHQQEFAADTLFLPKVESLDQMNILYLIYPLSLLK